MPILMAILTPASSAGISGGLGKKVANGIALLILLGLGYLIFRVF